MNLVRKKEVKLALKAMPFSRYKKEQRFQSPVGPLTLKTFKDMSYELRHLLLFLILLHKKKTALELLPFSVPPFTAIHSFINH